MNPAVQTTPVQTTPRKRECGAVLLAAMLLLVVVSAYAFLIRLNAAASISYQQHRSVRALGEAKDALIGYALTYAENHTGQPQGYLPCPDADGDGSADPPCDATGVSVLGRLPWRTLGIEPLRDGGGECLWYAVSGPYKALGNNKAALTSDTDGLFEIQDAAGSTIIGGASNVRATAVVFAPGRALGNQDRSSTPVSRTECGSTNAADPVNDPTNYLETAGGVNNATGAGNGGSAMPTPNWARFVMSTVAGGAGAATFNDTVLPVTPGDFAAVYRRMDQWVAERVRTCLQAYAGAPGAGGLYPWASVLNPLAAPDYVDDAGERFGRIPDAPLNNTVASALAAGNSMSSVWPPDPNAPAQTCFDDSAPQVAWSWWWWTGWKQSVMYAVDSEFSPIGTGSAPAALAVDGAQARAAVLVAGRTLNGQARSSDALRGDIVQYLENDNIPGAGTGAIPPGSETFGNADASATFNDVVCSEMNC